jgi:hypothetical protein
VDLLSYILSKALVVIFAVGVVGCLLVVPMTAIALFRVLFKEDSPDDIERSKNRDYERISPASAKQEG